ncbi:exodeoxyribonuclease V subunit alpha [Variovorax sp. HJSM1_2]|uniref:exodeoxyribonuclease V subunit alpha n=1 Tax=Variovorax sp. HJSM1_2 TaxID=3366263 RepID=UPI003BCF2CCA
MNTTTSSTDISTEEAAHRLLLSPNTSVEVAAQLAQLSRWVARGWLRELDRALAAFLAQQAPDAHALLILAAALASHQLGRGHVCLDLATVLENSRFALALPPDREAAGALPQAPGDSLDARLAGLTLASWQAALAHPLLVGTGVGNTPLVLVGARLYTRRYWQYEQSVRASLEQRLVLTPTLQAALPEAAMHAVLAQLFPPTSQTVVDWQKLACALAARSGFAVITGGPGTGKTTTVVRLLALLQSLALAESGRALRIRLAAPTGKAAARLNASIAGAVRRLPLQALADVVGSNLSAERLQAAVPTEVTTLHRLLGTRPGSRSFRHHAQNLLPVDLLVVDEASMVDLEMMAAVLAALPPHARLILLGDKDQLASVEAGAVLGELCRHAREGRYTPATCAWLEHVAGDSIPPDLQSVDGSALDQAVAMLRHSHRFSANSGIGRLAEAVNTGDVRGPLGVRKVLAQGYPDVARLVLEDASLPLAQQHTLRALVVDGTVQATQARIEDEEEVALPVGYRHYLQVLKHKQPPAHANREAFDAWARTVLEAHAQFQVLAALRNGPWGVEGLNQSIAAMLQSAGLISHDYGWYLGRPVLVTRNDYDLGLMNGDVGVTLALPQHLAVRHAANANLSGNEPPVLRVAFAANDGSGDIQWVLPSRLQAAETVYAMTVHKSQGSEFTHAALVLPTAMSPVLTRELVYTGITRAKHWFSLANVGQSAAVLEAATQRRVLRASGLLDENASE